MLMTNVQHSIKADCAYDQGEGIKFRSEGPKVICKDFLLKPDFSLQTNFALELDSVTGYLDKTTTKFLPHDSLIISNSNIKSISCDTIENLHVLNIKSSKLANVDSNFWKCGTRLRHLEIDGSTLKEPFSTALVKHQPELRHLIIKRMDLPRRLTKASFQNLPNLEEFYLESVELDQIDGDAFINLPNLQKLVLRLRKPIPWPSDIVGLEKLAWQANDGSYVLW